MKLNKYIIALIFVILLSRFIFEFSTPEFSNGKSYFYIKQIESIKDTGKVSQTEAQNINLLTLSPLFSYLLVPFSIFGNGGIKIFISLLIVFAAIVLFYFSKLFCKDEKICFISTLLFSFSPVLFKITLNKISLIPIILFLMLGIIYFSLNLKFKNNITYFIILSFILALISPMSILIAFALIIYLLLMLSESMKLERLKGEAIIFCIFAIIFSNLLIYKNVLFSSGLQGLTQNTPLDPLNIEFASLSIINLILSVGVLILIFGIIGLIASIYSKPPEYVLINLAFIISTIILLIS